jgi:hypothetical protein
MSEDTDFLRLKKMVREAHSGRSKWRAEAKTNFDLIANHQWSEEDMEILDEQNRPAVSFNRAAPLVDAVCGLEINNRQGVVYLPREQGDVGADEARTNLAKWVRDVCAAEDEESEAFRDMVICGEGWTETRMDYDENVQGQIVEERVDPLEVGVNVGAQKTNYKDARLVYRTREMEYYEAKDLFESPLEAPVIHAAWFERDETPADGGEGFKKDFPDKTRDALERESGRNAKVVVVQVQWWEREPVHLVAVDGAPDLEELSPDDFKQFESRVQMMQQADMAATQQHAAMPIDLATGALVPPPEPTAPTYNSAKVMRRCYYEGFLGAAGMIDKKKMEVQEFTLKVMTGKRDRKMNCFYGMVRDMVDPQRWGNKWLSQTLHILNSNAKGGIMAETDAFANVKKAEQDWSNPNKIVWVKPGAIEKNKIKERNPPPVPQGLSDLIQFAMGSLRDVTGVNLELLGQADREQAASLEAQRRQSAMTTLASLFNSLRHYRKDQGRLLLKFIELLPEGTLYYVLEQGQHKYVPLIKKGDIAQYDVILDQSPTSPDQKQYIWSVTTQLLASGLQLPMPVIVQLLKYSPYPESVVAEIGKALGLDGQQSPEQLQEKLAQAEQALQVMEQALQKATNEAESEEKKLDIDRFNAETQRLKVRLDALIKGRELQQQPAADPESLDGDPQQEEQADVYSQ